MALRAGYYGIKNVLLKKLQGLSDALVIKSIGEGLNLSAAGELSNTSTGGLDYSTSEQDTGIKWTDNKHIYQKTFIISVDSETKSVDFGVEGTIENVISINGTWSDANNSFLLEYARTYHCAVDVSRSSKLVRVSGNVSGENIKVLVTIKYTKQEASRSTKKK